MIKLRDLITETVDGDVLRLSKEGASKPFLKDFDRVFKKKSKEFGYGKLDKKTLYLSRLSKILGGGMSSKLLQKIVEKENICFSNY